MILNGKLHMIGGTTQKHLVYDDTANTFNVLHSNLNALCMHTPGIIKIKNIVLMFGGMRAGRCKDQVYEYDIIENIWTEFKVTMPIALALCSYTTVLNQQYVLLLGGCGGESHQLQDEIWIYSVQNEEFKKSKIKCPNKGFGDAFTERDQHKDKLAMFGFVRDVWIKDAINEQLFPPEYLIRIMNRYYTNEWVHLFRHKRHWKINVIDFFE